MSLQEATSALDSLTEQSIQTALSRVQSTRVTVAHRLSTIMDSDNIVVMKVLPYFPQLVIASASHSPYPYCMRNFEAYKEVRY